MTLALVAACGHGAGNGLGTTDGGGRVDGGGGPRDTNGGDAPGSPDPDGGSPGTDGGSPGTDGGSPGTDGGSPGIDAGGTSTHPMTESGTVSCWSVGGFQAVYHDQPAHIVVTLSDGDGIGDIVTTADVTIVGHYGALYQVGQRPLISLGDSGCCETTVKVPIYYDDFVAAGQAVGGPDTQFWSAYATFHDHGGTSIVARCDDEWFLDDAYYGN